MKSRAIVWILLALWGSGGWADSPAPPVVTVVSPIAPQRILPDTEDIVGVVDTHLYIAGSPGEFENCSFVVSARSPLKAVTVVAGDLTDAAGHKILAECIDIKAIKCWYQDLGAGYNEKVPSSYYDPTCANQIKTLVPELLLNDPSLIKVDSAEQQNYMRIQAGGTLSYELLSGTEKGLGLTGVQFAPSDDAESMRPVAVERGKNQQYYVTVELPYGTTPGVYRGTVNLLDEERVLIPLALTVRVLPITLPGRGHEVSGVYHNMPYLRETREELLAQYRREVASMKRHGIDNPGIGGGSVAKWLSGIVTLKDLLEEQKAAGVDISRSYFFMVGYHAEDSLTPEGRKRILDAKRMAEEAGVKELYIYSHDEALANGYDMNKMHQAMADASKLGVKVAGAGIPAGYMNDWRAPGNIGFLGDVQNLMISLGYPSRSEATAWHSRRQLIACYSNPMHGLEQPDAYRRNFGILLWQYGYDGAFNYAEPAWGDFWSQAYKRHAFAYPTKNGYIETVQFEGYREGMDDVRYVKALERELAAGTGSADAIRRGRQYLDWLKQGDINRDVVDSNGLRLDLIGYLLALQTEVTK